LPPVPRKGMPEQRFWSRSLTMICSAENIFLFAIASAS
jgi:hypothetical protein